MEDRKSAWVSVPWMVARFDSAPSVFYDAIKDGRIRGALRLGKALRVPRTEFERIEREGLESATPRKRPAPRKRAS